MIEPSILERTRVDCTPGFAAMRVRCSRVDAGWWEVSGLVERRGGGGKVRWSGPFWRDTWGASWSVDSWRGQAAHDG